MNDTPSTRARRLTFSTQPDELPNDALGAAEPSHLSASVPISTFSGAKVSKSAEKVDFSKVRTECLYKVELGMGTLPEHEITETLLA